MEGSTLCNPNLGPRLSESEFWPLILHHNQRCLGHTSKRFFITRKRACVALTPEEWLDLRVQLVQQQP